MAQDDTIPVPLKSGATDNPDAPQSGAVAPPPLPSGYQRPAQAVAPPPLPTGYQRPAAPVAPKAPTAKRTPVQTAVKPATTVPAPPVQMPDQGARPDAVEDILNNTSMPTLARGVKGMYEGGKSLYQLGTGLYHGLAGDQEEAPAEKPTTLSPVSPNMGTDPEHMGHTMGQYGRMGYDFLKGLGSDVTGVGTESGKPMPLLIPDKKPQSKTDEIKQSVQTPTENTSSTFKQAMSPDAQTLIGKYIFAPSAEEHKKSEAELEKFRSTPDGAAAIAHGLQGFIHHTLGEYVPFIGPLVGDIMDTAAKGDLGGALAKTAALYVTHQATEAGKGMIKNAAAPYVAKATEAMKSPAVKQAEANVKTTGDLQAEAQRKHDAITAKVEAHSASGEQGVAPPENLTKQQEKTQAALDEANFHHEAATDKLNKAQEANTIPARAGRAVGKVLPKGTPEVPAEQVTAAPPAELKTLGPGQSLAMPKLPADEMERRQVMNTPQAPPPVSPAHAAEAVRQPPSDIPQALGGRATLPGGEPVGRLRQLGEGTPIGPQVPEGGLPKIKEPEAAPVKAPKPTRGRLGELTVDEKGNVVEKDPQGAHLQRLLEESLQNTKGNENFPAATVEPETKEAPKVEEAPEEKRKGEDRRHEEVPVEEERRVGPRRNAAGIRVDAEGNPEMSPDIEGHWQASAFGEKPIEDIGARSREENPEPTRDETKGKEKPKEVLYRGVNADEARKIEETGKITPDAFSSGHVTPDKATAESYAKANGGKVYTVDTNDIKPEDLAHYRETGRGPITLSSEVPTVEHKGRAALPKEEPTGYTGKKEELVKTGEEGRETAKSGSEYHPVVRQKVYELGNEDLDKLAKAHGLDPTAPEYSRSKEMRNAGRHQTGRQKLADDIMEQMGDDEKVNIGRAAEAAEKEPGFENRDQSGKAKAARARELFPRLRNEEGPASGYGSKNKGVTKEAKDAAVKSFNDKATRSNAGIDPTMLKDAAKVGAYHAEAGARELVDIISYYNKENGLGKVNTEKKDVDPRRKEIAEAYDKMQHAPDNPEVKKAYKALIDDAKKQWNALEAAGIKIEPQDKDPYNSYDEMKKDFEQNRRLKVFRGGNPLPEDHPLAQVDPKTGETYNVMFRAVHDAVGHLMGDNDFSEKGEENAFQTHRQTMSKDAVPAMTTETKGQVAAFFNGGNEFPDQKAGVLPERFHEDSPDAKPVLDHLKSDKPFALLTAENPNNERATPEQNAKRNTEMKADLEKMGYKPVPIEGHNADVEGEKENSFFVPDITPEDAAKVSKKYGQASVMTREGIHDLKKDTVHPAGKMITGPEAAKQDYHSTVGGEPFSIPVDFDKEGKAGEKAGFPDKVEHPTVETPKGAKSLPTNDQLVKKYGETQTTDPKHVVMILDDGRQVPNSGTDHDIMLGGKATDKNPPRERWVQGGGVRLREYQGTAGRKIGISIPETGINSAQWERLKKMAPQLSVGTIMLEVGKPGGKYEVIPYGEASAERLENSIKKLTNNGEEPQSLGSARAGTALGKEEPLSAKELKERLPDLAQKHLTEQEKEGITTTASGKPRSAGTATFVKNMAEIPTVREYVDIARQGEGARKWYSRSSAAFDAMAEEAPEAFKEPGDKEKFLGLLAGSSPQQSVAMNLREALGFWKEWNDAGRPKFSIEKWKEFSDKADADWKEDGSPRVGGTLKGASKHWDYAPTGPEWKNENLLLKNLTLPETKIPNVIKALSGEDMWPDLTKNQAFKAPSFAENLRKWLEGKSTGTKHVTNDSWMGLFGGIDKSALSKPENYHPLSVATRAAAEELGWEPEEAQAAIWSFTQALTEKGVEDPELIRHYSEDFKDLLANDLTTRNVLEDLGVNLGQLDKKLDAIGEKPQVSEIAKRGAGTTAHSVGQLKERIETARGKGAIPKPKTVQGSLFKENPSFENRSRFKDEATGFNPDEFGNEESDLKPLGEKKKPGLKKLK